MVGRRLVEQVGRSDLAQAPEVHDGDAVADVLHDGEVVRNEEDRQVVLLLQVLQQVEDLRLHRDVERGDDLVAHQQLRLQHQGPGDADALALAARELAGPPRAVDVGVDPDLVEHGARRLDPLLLGADLPDGQRLGHDVDDASARVQRGDRVLEDHLHLRPQCAQVAAAERRQLGLAEHDPARGGLLDLDDGPPGRGLAAARLADEPERLALAQGEGDAGDGLHGRVAPAEGDVEVLDREQRVGRHRRGLHRGVGHAGTGSGWGGTAAGSFVVSGNQQA